MGDGVPGRCTMATRPRILVIDDEESIRGLLAEDLENRGYETIAVGSGKEAVEAAGKVVPAVFVIDLMLEDMPGLAVMNAVKKICPDSECIMITGQAPERSAMAAAELGAFGYMMKPPELALLDLMIRKAVERVTLNKTIRKCRQAVRTLLTMLDEPAVLIDRDGTIVDFNEKALSGAGNETQARARSLYEVLSPETAADVRASVQRAIDGADGVAESEGAARADPVKNDDGEVTCLIVRGIDISGT